ncbi:hypothetical protein BH24ACT12_BH24ACT12_01000 [soil metagenome]
MRVEDSVTAVSWIPSEAVTGVVLRIPFEVGLAHYDEPPPDVLLEIESFLAADRARFVNRLHAWIEVRDGVVVDYWQDGSGRLGATTLRLGGRGLTFAAVALPDRRRAEPVGDGAVRFEQTAGGRTSLPAPRRVSHPPYVQFSAPLAWTTLGLTLRADGSREFELAGASPFPRHCVYDDAGRLVSKSALERELSRHVMRAGAKPEIRRLAPGDRLTEQGEQSDELYLLLDGVLGVDVDGEALAEIGPGGLLGERAILEAGRPYRDSHRADPMRGCGGRPRQGRPRSAARAVAESPSRRRPGRYGVSFAGDAGPKRQKRPAVAAGCG